MHCIQIYRHQGTWAFTDDDYDLLNEPFVAGIPEFIDHIIKQSENVYEDSKFLVTFGKNQFPTATFELKFDRDDMGGAWYKLLPVETAHDNANHLHVGGEGWLCPATLNYFEDFPRSIFVQITHA